METFFSDADLRQRIGETHRRYTRYINFQKIRRDIVWQGLLGSDLLEGDYTKLRQHEQSGRPLESLTARRLRKHKPGPREGN